MRLEYFTADLQGVKVGTGMIKSGFCFYKDNCITQGDPEFSFDLVALEVPVKHG